MFAESRRLLVGVLLSERHETCRELGARFLQQVSVLSSIAHHWVLLLLSGSMAEAESKPRFCSEYFQQFARAIQALPHQSQAVSASSQNHSWLWHSTSSCYLKCPESLSSFGCRTQMSLHCADLCSEQLICAPTIIFHLHRCSKWRCKQPISC